MHASRFNLETRAQLLSRADWHSAAVTACAFTRGRQQALTADASGRVSLLTIATLFGRHTAESRVLFEQGQGKTASLGVVVRVRAAPLYRHGTSQLPAPGHLKAMGGRRNGRVWYFLKLLQIYRTVSPLQLFLQASSP